MREGLTSCIGDWPRRRREDEKTLLDIKVAADPSRHGAIVPITDADRQALFTKTWDIVDAVIKNA